MATMDGTGFRRARRAAATSASSPLADRMRPRTLDEFAGQDHIIGPGRLLRRAIEADQLSSLIFYGPPGTGKTTLARIIANTTDAHFVSINAVLAGVKDIRAAVAEASELRQTTGQRTILFVDEVHRFNKAQQDALLPWVENGTVVLIGATTENPYFEVNKALVSRSRLFQLRPLTAADLKAVAQMALSDPERGYGKSKVVLAPDALEHLVDVANGDARGVLNALELAVETTPPDADGRIVVDLAVAEESIQRRAVLYDKEGDAHFDTISAFIKSLRGSDPDAALYWLARMVYAGEDPRFILRRMLILACEDVGLADPRAIQVVGACAQAFDYVGLPEGQFHLAVAALYLATAPKSNSALSYFDALASVEKERTQDVPAHLKDASRDKEGFGHGVGYQYPHAYREHWTAQQYLPEALQGRVFYEPSEQGHEGEIRLDVLRRRDAQLAAMAEGTLLAQPEVLTYTGRDLARGRDAWLARVSSSAAERLGALRDRVLDGAVIQRQSRVLVLGDGSGLLTWEAVRRAPEGGVWVLAESEEVRQGLEAAMHVLGHLDRPAVLVGELGELAALLGLRGEAGLTFDAVVGRNRLQSAEAVQDLGLAVAAMSVGARLSLAESVLKRSSRPSSLLPESADKALLAALQQAEDLAYGGQPARGAGGPGERLAWEPSLGQAALTSFGLADVNVDVVVDRAALAVTHALVDRWFGSGARYAAVLGTVLDQDDVARVKAAFEALVGRRPLPWQAATAYVTARRSAARA
jgi:putative ATPase